MDQVKHRRFVVVLSALVLAAFAVGLGVAVLSSGGVAAESTAGGVEPKPTAASSLEGWVEGVVGTPVSGGKVVVGGWAADRTAGAPVTKVEVLLDGKSVATATLGVERADVAKTIGRDGYAKSGWNVVLDLSGVTPGKHEVSAVAHGKDGARQPLSGPRTIDVVPAS